MQNDKAIMFVQEQTYDISMDAVRQNGLALEYVKDQTYDICLAAIENNGDAFAYVKDQTPEICYAFAIRNPENLDKIVDDSIKKQILDQLQHNKIKSAQTKE